MTPALVEGWQGRKVDPPGPRATQMRPDMELPDPGSAKRDTGLALRQQTSWKRQLSRPKNLWASPAAQHDSRDALVCGSDTASDTGREEVQEAVGKSYDGNPSRQVGRGTLPTVYQ